MQWMVLGASRSVPACARLSESVSLLHMITQGRGAPSELLWQLILPGGCVELIDAFFDELQGRKHAG